MLRIDGTVVHLDLGSVSEHAAERGDRGVAGGEDRADVGLDGLDLGGGLLVELGCLGLASRLVRGGFGLGVGGGLVDGVAVLLDKVGQGADAGLGEVEHDGGGAGLGDGEAADAGGQGDGLPGLVRLFLVPAAVLEFR